MDLDDYKRLVRTYFINHFPYELIWKLLSENGCEISNREIAVQLIKRDIFVRYLSYDKVEDMKVSFRDEYPNKIYVGAEFDSKPKIYKRVQKQMEDSDNKDFFMKNLFRPVERELVFDIDLSDYDDIRVCCVGKNICKKCWSFVEIAVLVLKAVLVEDYGFQHLLWMFSGRRGIHCWVFDKEAKRYKNSDREDLLKYLKFPTSVEIVENLNHFALRRAVEICTAHLHTIAAEQEFFNHEKNFEKFVSLIPCEELREIFAKSIEGKPLKNNTHNIIKIYLVGFGEYCCKKSSSLCKEDMDKVIMGHYHLIFYYTYPRFDEQVTTSMNHLLRMPLSIHPGTFQLCVPFNPERVQDFIPSEVPQVCKILRQPEILKPYLEILKEFVKNLEGND